MRQELIEVVGVSTGDKVAANCAGLKSIEGIAYSVGAIGGATHTKDYYVGDGLFAKAAPAPGSNIITHAVDTKARVANV